MSNNIFNSPKAVRADDNYGCPLTVLENAETEEVLDTHVSPVTLVGDIKVGGSTETFVLAGDTDVHRYNINSRYQSDSYIYMNTYANHKHIYYDVFTNKGVFRFGGTGSGYVGVLFYATTDTVAGSSFEVLEHGNVWLCTERGDIIAHDVVAFTEGSGNEVLIDYNFNGTDDYKLIVDEMKTMLVPIVY